MRNSMIALLLCACSQTALVKRPSAMRTAVEAAITITEYQWFYRELSAGHYDVAKNIADQKKIDHRKVMEDVLAVMWQEVNSNEMVEEAQKISQAFKLDRATELVFAKSAFDSAVKANLCENASEIASRFKLGMAYFDRAINCAMSQYEPGDDFYELSAVADFTCGHPGTELLKKKLMASWIEIFEQDKPSRRHYMWMADIAATCTFTAEQYAGLFELGILAGELEFSLSILQAPGFVSLGLNLQPLYRRLYQATFAPFTGAGALSALYDWSLAKKKNKPSRMLKLSVAKYMLADVEFIKTTADYEKFVNASVNQSDCGMAVTAALKYKLSDAIIEGVFLNPKCIAGTLYQIDTYLVPPEKAKWFFDISLQAHEYFLAHELVGRFKLGDFFYSRIVDEAIIAKDFDSVIDLDPPAGLDKRLYQKKILDGAISLNEEWFIVRYAYAPNNLNQYSASVDLYWDNWIRLAYEHALGRNAFTLAADIANKRRAVEERKSGTALAFELALKANSTEAEQIAIRWPNPYRSAWLNDIKQKEAEAEEKRQKKREEKRRRIRACKIGDDWCVRQVR